MKDIKKILVAGGDGFIGSHIVRQLLLMGYPVKVMTRKPLVFSQNLAGIADRLEWIKGDADIKEELQQACSGCSVVYYFVSSTNPALTWQNPMREVDETIRRAVSLFEIAAKAGVRKVILPSSGGTVYGRQKNRLTEELIPQPFSPHGIAKYTTEMFANYFRERSGLQVDIFRISNPYGPGQSPLRQQGVVVVWMDRIRQGMPIEVYGDEITKRDYIYIEDAAKLMTISIRSMHSSRIWNIGSGVGTSIIELLNMFRDVIPVHFEVQFYTRRSFDNLSSVLDNSQILKLFPDFEPVSLRTGLRRTWAYLTKAGSTRNPNSS